MTGLATPPSRDAAVRLAFAEALQVRLKDVPTPYPDRPAYDRAIDELRNWLRSEVMGRPELWPLKTDDGSDVTRLGIGGLTASSTAGFIGACNNWIAQVRRKAGAA